MKQNLWKSLAFILYFISPFIIVYFQYTVFTGDENLGTTIIEKKGLVIFLALVIFLMKYLEKKKNVKEIQDKSPMFRVVYTGFKRLGICIGIIWILQTISANTDQLITTMILFVIVFILGFICDILGAKKKSV